MPNKEFIVEWVQELRTGNRAQCEGFLHKVVDGQDSFCCLGVAEDMLVAKGLAARELIGNETICPIYRYYDNPDDKTADYDSGVLTEGAVKYIGLKDPNPNIVIVDGDSDPNFYSMVRADGRAVTTTLAELNDAGFTFNQIADIIEYFLG